MVLTWYLDKVIPSTNDSTKKPWFIFNWIINCFKSKGIEGGYLLQQDDLIELNAGKPVEV